MDPPDDLILRVNEVYHDVEGARYAEIHPEIFHHEAARWQQVGRRLLGRPDRPAARVLDLGTGTGFVPLQLLPFLRGGDALVCADLSATMLDVCRRNLEAAQPGCAVEYLKLDGRTIGLIDATCDLVTMNSVLHHVPEFGPFLREVDRVLKVGGRAVVAHEPNRAFYVSRWLRSNALLATAALAPRRAIGALLRRLGLIDAVRRVLRRVDSSLASHADVVRRTNDQLLAERLIDHPLTVDEMTALVDAQSPTAGGFRAGKGIDVRAIVAEHLPHFAVESLETYNHLGDAAAAQRNPLTRRYDAALRRRFPESGATLMGVLMKGPSARD